jgi:hypothetical protein
MLIGIIYLNLVKTFTVYLRGRGGPPELVPMRLFEKIAVSEDGVCDIPCPKMTISVPPARDAPLTP